MNDVFDSVYPDLLKAGLGKLGFLACESGGSQF
jgi:hypothetical protein